MEKKVKLNCFLNDSFAKEIKHYCIDRGLKIQYLLKVLIEQGFNRIIDDNIFSDNRLIDFKN